MEAVDHESFGLWKLWIVEALDCLDRGSSEQWKPLTVEEFFFVETLDCESRGL